MAGFSTDMNIQQYNYHPVVLIDELSDVEFYIGYSRNFNNQSKPNWQIKRIWKVGTVWHFGFPNGNQDFKWIWDERYGYSYSI